MGVVERTEVTTRETLRLCPDAELREEMEMSEREPAREMGVSKVLAKE